MSTVWFGILLAGVMTSGCSRVTSTDDDGAATDQDGGVGTAGAAGRGRNSGSVARAGGGGEAGSDGGRDAGTVEPPHLLNVPWLLDVHGTGPDDVWAVGFTGVVLHFDGKGWTQTVDDFSVDLL